MAENPHPPHRGSQRRFLIGGFTLLALLAAAAMAVQKPSPRALQWSRP